MGGIMRAHAAGASEFELTSLINRFYRYLDDRNDDGLTDLFLEDGVWLRQENALTGHAQILALLKSRSPTLLVRHFVTNVMVNMSDRSTAEVSAYLIVIRHDNASDSPKPAPLETVPTVHTLYSEFCLSQIGWRIKYMKAGLSVFPGR
jgi:SnoaL-like domain